MSTAFLRAAAWPGRSWVALNLGKTQALREDSEHADELAPGRAILGAEEQRRLEVDSRRLLWSSASSFLNSSRDRVYDDASPRARP
ncbi:hypothetical protein PR003_g8169 [Phytophthora rubi]|uniref:Uncharacterized protein n=1 Tax=Phytophthora rubi TaxID=129364 RepID=A0A6A4FJU6_9STRA|nr:hypothetical protein PR003_g8169 [Phytophthora rubi]